MELTFLRGACVIIEAAGKRVLCDPWLEDGIYYGAWAHYPKFTKEDWEKYKPWDVDYIYISHIHPDHYDWFTMNRIYGNTSSNIPVLIHSYPSKFLKKNIEGQGYEVHEISHDQTFDMGGGLHMRILSADDCNPEACGAFFGCAMPGVRNTQIDSLAVISDSRHCIVNVNDCPYALSKTLAEKIGKDYEVDLALIAYAGAGPFPQCFKMPEAQKKDRARIKRRSFIDGVINFATALRAKRVFPFAGDYQLCGPLSTLNELRGVPDVTEVHGKLQNVGIPTLALNPGGSSPITSEGEYLHYHDLDRRSYVSDVLAICDLSYSEDPMPSQAELNRLVWPAYDRFNAKRREYGLKAKTTIYLKIDTGYYLEIPPEGQPSYNSGPVKQPHIVIETDPRLLRSLLQGPKMAHWNNAEIGSHLVFDRVGQYEPGLHHLMSFFHA